MYLMKIKKKKKQTDVVHIEAKKMDLGHIWLQCEHSLRYHHGETDMV